MNTKFTGQSLYSDEWFTGYYMLQSGKHYIVENGMAYLVKGDTVKELDKPFKNEHLLRSHNFKED